MFDVDKDLEFNLIGNKPKTKIYSVYNSRQHSTIGMIQWNSSWRHYCFFPMNDTVYSDRCLIRIGEFVEELNKKHLEKQVSDKVFK